MKFRNRNTGEISRFEWKSGALFYGTDQNGLYLSIDPNNFDLVEDAPKEETPKGLPSIFGQQLESMTVTFK